MNFLIVTLGVILLDRAIPAGGFRFTASALRSNLKAGWRDYGWVRFPRTLLGAGVCLCGGLIDFFLGSREQVGVAAAVLATSFAVAACVDTWRAFLRT